MITETTEKNESISSIIMARVFHHHWTNKYISVIYISTINNVYQCVCVWSYKIFFASKENDGKNTVKCNICSSSSYKWKTLALTNGKQPIFVVHDNTKKIQQR